MQRNPSKAVDAERYYPGLWRTNYLAGIQEMLESLPNQNFSDWIKAAGYLAELFRFDYLEGLNTKNRADLSRWQCLFRKLHLRRQL